MKCSTRRFFTIIGCAILLAAVIFSFPSVLIISIQYNQNKTAFASLQQFPVTVDPRNKTITENENVNSLFESVPSPFQAAVENTGGIFWDTVTLIAKEINEMSTYQKIAGVIGIDKRVVTITPGMRKEQVANAFGKALVWNDKQQKEFVTAKTNASLPLSEGSFSPGTYLIDFGITPKDAQELVNKRFSEEILLRYGTTTAQVVPLNQALTIASLIQREASGSDDMRIISGIIWNRLFNNMNLQIDATVQYAKANSKIITSWWPNVTPSDTRRKSPYNTYLNSGLPPTPIANPSVAAVLAALNPKNTSCLFYFHDKAGEFHCSDTYSQHVALLKKYFGRGK